MNLQAQLNKQALDYLPKIKELIKNAEAFEANQMRCNVVRQLLNMRKPISERTSEDVKKIEAMFIESFLFQGWV